MEDAGHYNKFRRRFRQDWQRFSEGLDQDLKQNFEKVLRVQIMGPSEVVSSRMRGLAQQWGARVQQQEAHVRRLLRRQSLSTTRWGRARCVSRAHHSSNKQYQCHGSISSIQNKHQSAVVLQRRHVSQGRPRNEGKR